MGGEYRSIHFRTGRLGQGSRTALPIFGLFMNKVLNDPQLAPRYLKRYGAPPAGIEASSYKSTYYAPPADNDSTAGDSLHQPATEFGDDLPGAPANDDQPAHNPANVPAGESTPRHDSRNANGADAYFE